MITNWMSKIPILFWQWNFVVKRNIGLVWWEVSTTIKIHHWTISYSASPCSISPMNRTFQPFYIQPNHLVVVLNLWLGQKRLTPWTSPNQLVFNHTNPRQPSSGQCHWYHITSKIYDHIMFTNSEIETTGGHAIQKSDWSKVSLPCSCIIHWALVGD